MIDSRPDPAEDLRRTALELFARDGYDATSLQDIATAVGYTKANVLYHFGSKPALLAAALAPALAAFEELITRVRFRGPERDIAGVEAFLDFLFEHHLAVEIFINQASVLRGHPLVARANALLQRLGEPETGEGAAPPDARTLRLDIAVAGAAYCIAQRRIAEDGSARDAAARPLMTVWKEALGDDEYRRAVTEAVLSIASIP